MSRKRRGETAAPPPPPAVTTRFAPSPASLAALTALGVASALWALLLAPGLCLAGALEHLCSDCTEGASCGHEDDCADDPCGDVLLRPDTDSSGGVSAPSSAAPTAALPAAPRFLDLSPLLRAPSLPGKKLPRPESDLPLRI